MSTYVIGDIHGCYRELMQLLEKIEFDQKKDFLWCVGDLVNRGSDSLAVLRFFKALGDRAIVVLGNHDLHLLALAHDQGLKKVKTNFESIFEAKDHIDLLYWLQTRPLLHHDDTLNYVMVHAGIYSGWNLDTAKQQAKEVEDCLKGDCTRLWFKLMYGNLPAIWSDDLESFDRIRFIINTFTRMRLCDEKHELNLTAKNTIDSNTTHLYPWFEIPNRITIEPKIVFGHWAALGGVLNRPDVIGLDTGCCWGHELTALRLEDQKRFSVQSLAHFE